MKFKHFFKLFSSGIKDFELIFALIKVQTGELVWWFTAVSAILNQSQGDMTIIINPSHRDMAVTVT